MSDNAREKMLKSMPEKGYDIIEDVGNPKAEDCQSHIVRMDHPSRSADDLLAQTQTHRPGNRSDCRSGASASKVRTMYNPLKDQYYSCTELAEIMGIKPETLAGYAREQRLPAYHFYAGGEWFFLKDEIAAFLKKNDNGYSAPFVRPLRARSKAG